MIRVLGMDPSLANFGIALATIDYINNKPEIVIESIETIETRKEKGGTLDDFRRLALIVKRLEWYLPQVSKIYTEIPGGSRSARAANALGMMKALIVCYSYRKPTIYVTPMQTKRIIGNQKATKRDMINWAVVTHPEVKWAIANGRILAKNEHAADTVAVIHAGVAIEKRNKSVTNS